MLALAEATFVVSCSEMPNMVSASCTWDTDEQAFFQTKIVGPSKGSITSATRSSNWPGSITTDEIDQAAIPGNHTGSGNRSNQTSGHYNKSFVKENSQLISTILLGLTVFTLCVWYLLGYFEPERHHMIIMLRRSGSNFLMGLMFQSVRGVIHTALGTYGGWCILLDGIVFLSCYIAVECLIPFTNNELIYTSTRSLRLCLEALTCWSGVALFGGSQAYADRVSWALGLILMFITFALLWGLSAITIPLRALLGAEKEEELEKQYTKTRMWSWLNKLKTSQNYIWGFVVGYMLYRVAQGITLGHAPESIGVIDNPTQINVRQIVGGVVVGFLFLLLSVSSEFLNKILGDDPYGSTQDFVQRCFSVAAGWTLVEVLDWLVYACGYDGPHVNAMVFEAVGITTGGLFLVFFGDSVDARAETQSSGTENIDKMLNRLVGFPSMLAWLKAFESSCYAVGSFPNLPTIDVVYLSQGLQFGIALLMFPAWFYFVVTSKGGVDQGDGDS